MNAKELIAEVEDLLAFVKQRYKNVGSSDDLPPTLAKMVDPFMAKLNNCKVFNSFTVAFCSLHLMYIFFMLLNCIYAT